MIVSVVKVARAMVGGKLSECHLVVKALAVGQTPACHFSFCRALENPSRAFLSGARSTFIKEVHIPFEAPDFRALVCNSVEYIERGLL